MNAIQFIQSTLHELNRSYVLEVESLTTEQMFFRTTPDANSIAFLMWHFPRIEDSIFHSQVSKNENPTVWEQEQWDTQFNLSTEGTGMGFSPDQVALIQPDKEILIKYAEAVRLSVKSILENMNDDDLDRPVSTEDPKLTVGRRIQGPVIGHGFWHLGEIRFLKGLQGMPFPR